MRDVPASELLDRRAFLGGMGFVAGAAVATTFVPLSVVHALPSGLSVAGMVSVGSWHVDDVCGHWPPYSYPIGFPSAPTLSAAAVASSQADAVDHIFLI